jgi:hypothetical protein
MAQVVASPPLAFGRVGQSQRPLSEQATVSRPAEHRPGSGRWSRPQREHLALVKGAVKRLASHAGLACFASSFP